VLKLSETAILHWSTQQNHLLPELAFVEFGFADLVSCSFALLVSHFILYTCGRRASIFKGA
jgi:hypothetical protein